MHTAHVVLDLSLAELSEECSLQHVVCTDLFEKLLDEKHRNKHQRSSSLPYGLAMSGQLTSFPTDHPRTYCHKAAYWQTPPTRCSVWRLQPLHGTACERSRPQRHKFQSPHPPRSSCRLPRPRRSRSRPGRGRESLSHALQDPSIAWGIARLGRSPADTPPNCETFFRILPMALPRSWSHGSKQPQALQQRSLRAWTVGTSSSSSRDVRT